MARRAVIKPTGYPVPDAHFSPGIRYGDWVFVSATTASDYATGLVPEARGNPAVPLAGEAPYIRESRAVFHAIETVLKAEGTNLQNGVRLDQFPAARAAMDPYHVARRQMMNPPRPVSASVHVDSLLSPDANIAVELLALIPRAGLQREPITPKNIPQAIQGFTPAIRVGDYVFLAGQVATDFENGLAPEARVNPNFWEGSAIESETRYILKNVELTLQAAGSSLKNVVKSTVYLSDINDIARLDRVWREAFPTEPPARSVYPIRSFGVADICIEIYFVALVDDAKVKKEVIATDRARKPLFHESQAVRTQDFLFLSGLMACDESGLVRTARPNSHAPFSQDTSAAQMRDIMDQASAICAAAGTDLRHALRLLTVHTDLREYYSALNARTPYFPDGHPASTAIQVPAPMSVPGCSMLAELWVGTGP